MTTYRPIRSQQPLTDDSEIHDDGFCADAGCDRCSSDFDLDGSGRSPIPSTGLSTLRRSLPRARWLDSLPLPPP
jgi:hypothetical protein